MAHLSKAQRREVMLFGLFCKDDTDRYGSLPSVWEVTESCNPEKRHKTSAMTLRLRLKHNRVDTDTACSPLPLPFLLASPN